MNNHFLKFIIVLSLLGFAYIDAQEVPASDLVDLSDIQGKWISLNRPDDILIFTKQEGNVGEVAGFWHSPDIPCFSKLILNSLHSETKPFSIEVQEEIIHSPQYNCLVGLFTLTKKKKQIQITYNSVEIDYTYFIRDEQFKADQIGLEALARELQESEIYKHTIDYSNSNAEGTWVTYVK